MGVTRGLVWSERVSHSGAIRDVRRRDEGLNMLSSVICHCIFHSIVLSSLFSFCLRSLFRSFSSFLPFKSPFMDVEAAAVTGIGGQENKFRTATQKRRVKGATRMLIRRKR